MDRERSSATDEFRFLTTEEFNQLTQGEKMHYLARAVEATLSERTEGPVEFELFMEQERTATQHQRH